MKSVRLLVAASLIAGASLVASPAPARACAPDPDGVNPCDSCYTYKALVYKVTHKDLIFCPE